MTGPGFKIRNWENFQHYKDRDPPWIKLHFSLLASEDWVTLADASRSLMIACMLIGSRNKGMISDNTEYIKRVAYLKKVDFKPLIQCGFLIPLADASTMLANDTECSPEDIKKEQEQQSRDASAPASGGLTPEEMVGLWNKAVEFFSYNGTQSKIRTVRDLTDDRRRKCIARIKDCRLTEETWKDILNTIHTDDWLSGRTPSEKYPNWKASFDYVVRNQTNINRILEAAT